MFLQLNFCLFAQLHRAAHLNLRGAPSPDGPVLAGIPNGAAVSILGAYNDWRSVNYDGLIGWVKSEFLSV